MSVKAKPSRKFATTLVFLVANATVLVTLSRPVSDNKTNHAISWIAIYPMDSVIQPFKQPRSKGFFNPQRQAKRLQQNPIKKRAFNRVYTYICPGFPSILSIDTEVEYDVFRHCKLS